MFAKYLISGAMLLASATYVLYKPKAKYSALKTETTVIKTVYNDPATNYANYCSGCHGERMDAFADRQWKHGNTLKDIMYSIKQGWPNDGMPAFREAFTDDEVKELSEFILKGIKNVEQYNFKEVPLTGKFETEKLTITLDTVATGLDIPWGIAFLPTGELLVTERGGKMYSVKNKNKTLIKGVPEVLAEGQGGLLDVVLDPDFKNNNYIYFSFSKPQNNGGRPLATTAVMKARLKNNNLTDKKIIFEALPYAPTRHHYGSRLAFDKKGYLFISVGERGNEKENPQSLNNQLGKIHRINTDGTVPADNPFKDNSGKPTTLYCYGNRNPQGIAFNPWTNELWENEHGPRGGDEINIIKPGNNYGWPITSYGINYNGQPMTDKTTAPGITNPVLYWIPSIAPSGMAFVNSDVYKPWKGAVLVGSLRFKYLNICYLDGDKVTSEEKILKNIGRVRDVRVAPDGYIYVAVESPAAAVYRLIPTEK